MTGTGAKQHVFAIEWSGYRWRGRGNRDHRTPTFEQYSNRPEVCPYVLIPKLNIVAVSGSNPRAR